MKIHIQKPGIRKWSGNDLLDLQHEPLKAIEGFITNYAPCILAGCKIAPGENGAYTVSSGLLSMSGKNTEGQDTRKVATFAGATGVTLPLYLTLVAEVEQRPYVTNGVQPIAIDYHAVATAIKPTEGDYFTLNVQSPIFADVLQDAGHRFVSDAWLAGLQAKFDELLALLQSKFAELEGKIIDFKVGELRTLASDIVFNDPKYLPANGSAIHGSDYPDLAIAMKPQLIKDGTTLQAYAGLPSSSWPSHASATGNGSLVALYNLNAIVRKPSGEWVLGQDLHLHVRSIAYGKWGFVAAGNKWSYIAGSSSHTEAEDILRIFKSSDGITWTEISTISAVGLQSTKLLFDGQDYILLCAHNDKTVVLKSGANAGSSWLTRPFPTTIGNMSLAAFGNGIIAIACINSYGVYISKDKQNWEEVRIPGVALVQYLGYMNGHFYIGGAGKIISTTNFDEFTTFYEDSKLDNYMGFVFADGVYLLYYKQRDSYGGIPHFVINPGNGWVDVTAVADPLYDTMELGGALYTLKSISQSGGGFFTEFYKFTGSVHLPNHTVADSRLIPYIKVLK